ncbi:MAG: response regulator [gamma proteobacterium endosymbiont of Lamellibrachia anaximandri]|nr:response regulator [gamma proteobacterium endosymbiont of Lamellibrachia anaximandri]
MHFIGMLGFSIPCGVTYDPWITAFSMLPGILAGIFSLHLISRRNESGRMLLLGGIIFGSGIGVMHYSGMAAMRMDAFLRYDPKLFLLSILVAVALAVLALWVRYGVIRLFPTIEKHALLIASIVMGGAFSGMHYTAMSAAYFLVGNVTNITSSGFDPMMMAIVISGVTAFLIGTVLLYVFSQFSRQIESINTQLLDANNRLKYQKIALDQHAIVSMTDVKGDITYVNDKFVETSGYSRQELLGKNHRVIKSDEHSVQFYKQLWKTISNGNIWQGELKNLSKNGENTWLSSTIVPFVDEVTGKPYQYISVRTDITAIKDTEAALHIAKEIAEDAAKSKSEFLATMSHEIRTPMNGVLGMLHLLEKTALNESQKRYVNTAAKSSELLLSVINDILDFSKLDAKKLELESIEFNPILLVQETATLLAKGAQQKGLELISSIAPEVPCLTEGDPMRLRQILTNLTSNAIKFTETGHVILYASYIDEQLQLGVVDTGIGLTDQQQQKIFGAFNQADGSHTRKYGGTGLGLAISQRLVEAMDGSLEVASVPGIGSDFYFDLPLKRISEESCRLTLPESLSSKRILIADDYAGAQAVIERMLKNWNVAQTGLASDGDDCLAKLQAAAADNQPYDIILLDMDMPGMVGAELVQTLRGDAGSDELIIIGLRTLDHIEQVPGLDASINKPISQPDLLNTLLDLLGESVLARDAANSQEPQNWWFGGRKLLLVEDNPVNQEVASELLASAGFAVDIRENGEDAIKAVQINSYDAVFMDIQMPIMDGLTAARKIRQLGDDYAGLPILAMTAHALTGDKEKSLEAGMNGHITKPINPHAMFSELAEWVAQSEKPEHTDQEEEQAESEPLPELPGIDTADALDRIGGNQSAYRRILGNYRDRNLDVVERITANIRNDELTESAHLAHSLKGSSGNIGAKQVHQYAASVEQHCRNDQPAHALEALENLRASLQQVIDGLAQLDETSDEPVPIESNAGINLDGLQNSLQQLKEHLDTDLRQAGALLKEIQQQANGTELSQPLAEIEQALNEFDIDTSKTTIGRILKKA